jgi:hypothetical protein
MGTKRALLLLAFSRIIWIEKELSLLARLLLS